MSQSSMPSPEEGQKQAKISGLSVMDPSTVAGFDTAGGFALIQRMARAFSESTMVPEQYRNIIVKKVRGGREQEYPNPAALSNCIIALDIATRLNINPLMVMQNLYVVEGRPSWSSSYIIASINVCNKYGPLHFEIRDLEERDVEWTIKEWYDAPNGKRATREITKKARIKDKECIAWAIEKVTGERIESPPVSIGMAVAEGWYGKNGSKWQTMPEVMLRYRAASFFGKMYVPERLMGLPSAEEAQEIVYDLEPEPEKDGHYSVSVSEMSKATSSIGQSPSSDGAVSGEQATAKASRRGRLSKEELEALRKETLAAWEATGCPLSEVEEAVNQYARDWNAATCKKVKQLAAEKLSEQQGAPVDAETGEVAESEPQEGGAEHDSEPRDGGSAAEPEPQPAVEGKPSAEPRPALTPWGPDPGIHGGEGTEGSPNTPIYDKEIKTKMCPSISRAVYIRQCDHCRERTGCPAWEEEDGRADAGGGEA